MDNVLCAIPGTTRAWCAARCAGDGAKKRVELSRGPRRELWGLLAWRRPDLTVDRLAVRHPAMLQRELAWAVPRWWWRTAGWWWSRLRLPPVGTTQAEAIGPLDHV